MESFMKSSNDRSKLRKTTRANCNKENTSTSRTNGYKKRVQTAGPQRRD